MSRWGPPSQYLIQYNIWRRVAREEHVCAKEDLSILIANNGMIIMPVSRRGSTHQLLRTDMIERVLDTPNKGCLNSQCRWLNLNLRQGISSSHECTKVVHGVQCKDKNSHHHENQVAWWRISDTLEDAGMLYALLWRTNQRNWANSLALPLPLQFGKDEPVN